MSIKPSLGPFRVWGPVQLHKSHAHEATPIPCGFHPHSQGIGDLMDYIINYFCQNLYRQGPGVLISSLQCQLIDTDV